MRNRTRAARRARCALQNVQTQEAVDSRHHAPLWGKPNIINNGKTRLRGHPPILSAATSAWFASTSGSRKKPTRGWINWASGVNGPPRGGPLPVGAASATPASRFERFTDLNSPGYAGGSLMLIQAAPRLSRGTLRDQKVASHRAAFHVSRADHSPYQAVPLPSHSLPKTW